MCVWYWLRTSKTKFLAQGGLFAPERQRVGNAETETGIEDEGEERGGTSICRRGLPLDREETACDP